MRLSSSSGMFDMIESLLAKEPLSNEFLPPPLFRALNGLNFGSWDLAFITLSQVGGPWLQFWYRIDGCLLPSTVTL